MFLFVLLLATSVAAGRHLLATCPDTPKGYMFYVYKDSGGADLLTTPVTGSVQAMANECTARGANCQGFNSNGWLKSKITPSSGSWVTWTTDACKGMYVKKPCPDVPQGYLFVPKKDSAGGDLAQLSRTVDVDANALKCNQAATCKGFNSNGYLKTAIKPSSPWPDVPDWASNACKGLYVKTATSCNSGSAGAVCTRPLGGQSGTCRDFLGHTTCDTWPLVSGKRVALGLSGWAPAEGQAWYYLSWVADNLVGRMRDASQTPAPLYPWETQVQIAAEASWYALKEGFWYQRCYYDAGGFCQSKLTGDVDSLSKSFTADNDPKCMGRFTEASACYLYPDEIPDLPRNRGDGQWQLGLAGVQYYDTNCRSDRKFSSALRDRAVNLYGSFEAAVQASLHIAGVTGFQYNVVMDSARAVEAGKLDDATHDCLGQSGLDHAVRARSWLARNPFLAFPWSAAQQISGSPISSCYKLGVLAATSDCGNCGGCVKTGADVEAMVNRLKSFFTSTM